jgi:hypothetical protein
MMPTIKALQLRENQCDSASLSLNCSPERPTNRLVWLLVYVIMIVGPLGLQAPRPILQADGSPWNEGFAGVTIVDSSRFFAPGSGLFYAYI